MRFAHLWGATNRTCSKCGAEKDIAAFPKASTKNGRGSVCKPCVSARRAALRPKVVKVPPSSRSYQYSQKLKDPKYIAVRANAQFLKNLYPPDMKLCSRCEELLPLSRFERGRSVCHTCIRTRKKVQESPLRTAKRLAYDQKQAERKAYKQTAEYAAEKQHMQKEHKRRARAKVKADPVLRMDKTISEQIRLALRGKKHYLPWKTAIGYTLDELRVHLEAQFHSGMSWENYGEWHVDHITPKAVLPFTSMEDQNFLRLWGLQNLQPLWAWENALKRDLHPLFISWAAQRAGMGYA